MRKKALKTSQVVVLHVGKRGRTRETTLIRAAEKTARCSRLYVLPVGNKLQCRLNPPVIDLYIAGIVSRAEGTVITAN